MPKITTYLYGRDGESINVRLRLDFGLGFRGSGPCRNNIVVN